MRAWCIAILFLLIVVLLTLWCNRETYSDQETIFVSIASYRDSRCLKTIEDMYAKAKHPERIFAGICEQNTGTSGEECVPTNFKFHNNVRKISIPNKEAKGPCYARYLCSTLYRNETYFMQIDSHTTFVKDWDVKAISSLKMCPSQKAVLSGYPHDDKTYDIDAKDVPVLCDSFWNGDGLPQFKAIIIKGSSFKGKPVPIPFLSGGFIFAPGKLVRDVPYDPHLPHLFQGEEILYSARAWTSGYDFFTAPVNIVLHAYYRKEEPKFWEDITEWRADQKRSASRVRRILGIETPAIVDDPYALGKERTIQAYWKFAGLDHGSKRSKSKDKFCSF